MIHEHEYEHGMICKHWDGPERGLNGSVQKEDNKVCSRRISID